MGRGGDSWTRACVQERFFCGEVGSSRSCNNSSFLNPEFLLRGGRSRPRGRSIRVEAVGAVRFSVRAEIHRDEIECAILEIRRGSLAIAEFRQLPAHCGDLSGKRDESCTQPRGEKFWEGAVYAHTRAPRTWFSQSLAPFAKTAIRRLILPPSLGSVLQTKQEGF